jgi:hypothetical protein
MATPLLTFVESLEESGFTVLKNENESLEIDNLVFSNTNDTEFYLTVSHKLKIVECGFRKLGKRKRNMESGLLKDFDIEKALTL